MNRFFPAVLAVSLIILAAACNNPSSSSNQDANITSVPSIPPPATLRYTVLNVYPHDTLSYTQGLIVHNGQLYESTGGRKDYNPYKSWVGKVDLKSGKASDQVMLDAKYFGEGITILNDKLYQLTWTDKKGFVYDLATMKKLQEFPIKTEGWGLTTDSTNLILSDGSSNLYYLNPKDFSTLKVVSVTDNNGPVNSLNELEYYKGYIYANRYQTYDILKIDPSNGQVIGKADLTGILEQYSHENINKEKYQSNDAVLNGIAVDGQNGKMYITGKLWPSLYEVSFQ